ncbi:LAGLIDADG family homing endonuclease [Streptomyces bauhiniae]|uniref:LAGLIDADG family homing endonuclease n=1 Tax=Streptomyces bauhiniae TaxID=2340725 RepID=UPI00345113F3
MDLAVPEYAYMFGFLQADGHLAKGPGQKGALSVELGLRDAAILRPFAELTPYRSRITERTRSTNFAATHTSVTWTLYALEARTKLNALGLPYGRKSGTIAPPRVEFSGHDYVRGLIDGDGSVGFTGKGRPFLGLTTASTAIAAYVCDYGAETTGVERTVRRNARDGMYNIVWTNEAAQRLAAALYYPDCLALDRKRTAARSVAVWVRPEGMRAAYTPRRWSPDEDRVLLGINSPTAAAEALGRTTQSCNLRLWRLRTGQVPLPA